MRILKHAFDKELKMYSRRFIEVSNCTLAQVHKHERLNHRMQIQSTQSSAQIVHHYSRGFKVIQVIEAVM